MARWACDRKGTRRSLCCRRTGPSSRVLARLRLRPIAPFDDERQRRHGPPDPRNAEVRPLALGCRSTLTTATLPLAEQSGRVDAATPIGVEQSDRSPMSTACGHLLLFSHGYLGDIGRRPALRGGRRTNQRPWRQPTTGSGATRNGHVRSAPDGLRGIAAIDLSRHAPVVLARDHKQFPVRRLCATASAETEHARVPRACMISANDRAEVEVRRQRRARCSSGRPPAATRAGRRAPARLAERVARQRCPAEPHGKRRAS